VVPISEYADLGVTTDPSALYAEALKILEEEIPGFTPNPASLLIILLQVIARLAANLQNTAQEITFQVFNAFGTEIIGLPYREGVPARINLVFESLEAAPSEGLTIPQGTFVSVAGYGFQTAAEATILSGQTTVTVAAEAVAEGEAYNELSQEVILEESLNFVKSVSAAAPSYGGVKAEDETEYVNRLVAYLQLSAPRPITALDYANFALSADIPNAAGTGYVDVTRAVALDGYKPGTTVFEATVKTGELTLLQEVTSFTGVTVGSELTDVGGVLVPGTTVKEINEGAKTITLSTPATALHAKEKITASGTYNNERCVTLKVLGPEGAEVPAEEREAIHSYIAGGTIAGKEWPGFREINFILFVEAPLETGVNISYAVQVLPEYSTASVEAAIEAALEQLLSPLTWRAPGAYQSSVSWLNKRIVGYNKVIGVIEGVKGVDECTSLKLSTSESPTPGTADVTLIGPTPLPRKLFSQAVTGNTEASGKKVKSLPKSSERHKGLYVSGKGIPASTYITSVVSETEVELSANATEALTATPLTIASVQGALTLESFS
jgi:hypothetical protein